MLHHTVSSVLVAKWAYQRIFSLFVLLLSETGVIIQFLAFIEDLTTFFARELDFLSHCKYRYFYDFHENPFWAP